MSEPGLQDWGIKGLFFINSVHPVNPLIQVPDLLIPQAFHRVH
jgi:hypothetical protein